MKKIKAMLMLSAVLAMVMSLSIAPANANPGVGQVAFECTASLPLFPAASGANGACQGTATGFVVTTAGPKTSIQGTFRAAFSYNEPAATCPATGTAAGNFWINEGTADQIAGTFTWTRAGATAVITLANINGAGLTSASGEATAAFESPQAVAACSNPQPITATVAGEATVHDTN